MVDFFHHVTKLVILQLVLPLSILTLVRERPSDYGLNVKNAKFASGFIALFVVGSVPAMWWASGLAEFRTSYPLWPPAREGLAEFVLFELTVGLLIFTTEFFFRGYLLFPFGRLGVWSVLPQTIPYVWVHVGAPALELWAALFAGLIFGYVSYRTRSILPSFGVHWTVSVIFDILVMI
jgi:membrane protease YdiL (CAAX protease family)